MKSRTALRSAREAAGLTQQELGFRCGVTGWTINRIELGERSPSFALIERIVAELGGAVSPDDFFIASNREGNAA